MMLDALCPERKLFIDLTHPLLDAASAANVCGSNLLLGKTEWTARRDAPDAKFHSAGSNVESERRSGF